jgi:tetratricopeptide (TPR) repeat protein
VNAALLTDPTPEFNERCMAIINRYGAGELPIDEALEQMTLLYHEAENDSVVANLGRAEHLLGYLSHYKGNLNTSIRHYERARAIWVQVGNQRRMAMMDLNQGENFRYKGDFNRARKLYRAAYEVADQLNIADVRSMALANEGQMLLAMGRYDDALDTLLRALDLTDALEAVRNRDALRCEVHHALAMIYLHNNALEDAWQHARVALETARANNDPLQLGFANRAVGEVLTALGSSPDPAFGNSPDEYYIAAIKAFREINVEAECARTVLAHGKSLARRGKRLSAARKLQQAMIIFTDLDMVDDAARTAEAQLVVLGAAGTAS